MQSSTPSLPTIRSFPLSIGIEGLTGFLYGTVFQINPKLMTLIFMIRGIADNILYQLINLASNLLVGSDEVQSQKIYLINSSFINLAFLTILRDLNLFGRLFSYVLGVGCIGQLIYRVRYIDNHEP